jgi:hypothetical protein
MIDRLPNHLAERTRQLNGVDSLNGDGPVVVWLKSSFRVHENPAIEVGATIAQQNGLPLLIYHGIDERYPHASLRPTASAMMSDESSLPAPSLQQLNDAAWELARFMFEAHAHPSEPTYAVQTRLF